MYYKFLLPLFCCILLTSTSCNSQQLKNAQTEPQSKEPNLTKPVEEPHRYGGWYCPDNFGFVPVDIQKLNEVPAISNRLPTTEELHNHMSLIEVDTEKYPNAKALEMDLPRVARIRSINKGIEELVIVIQAIVIQQDTVLGYRFVNGGNGSDWLRNVTFLSEHEVAGMGSQPFFFSKVKINATPENIWQSLSNTAYFKELGEKFDKKDFFTSSWNPDSKTRLELNTTLERAVGYVGIVFGNYYLQIDYIRNGNHYSEKLLMSENKETNSTELVFASGPYPNDYELQNSRLTTWLETVKTQSEK